MSRYLACLLVLLSAGCGASRTEIVVEVHSDLAVPGQLDEIDISVDGVTGGPQTATAHLTGTGAVMLPGVLGVVHTDGPLGPITVTATGKRRGATVVMRVATTSFVDGHTVVLRMDLLGSCVGRMCGAGMTCGEMGCMAQEVPASSLPEWVEDAGTATDSGTDSPPPVDGGGVDMPPPPRDVGVDMPPPPRDLGVDMPPPPRDLGVDMPPPPVDMGGATCDSIFGAATGYMFCSETATSCTMAVNIGGGNCNTFCSGFGRTCMGAFGNVMPDCTSSGAETCMTPRTTEICVCSR